MPSVGPNYPSTSVSDSSTGTLAWTNPGNAVSDNASYATAVGPSSGLHATHYLKVTGFGFSVSGTIDGVVVGIERYSTANTITRYGVDRLLYLVKAGTIQTTGTNKANTVNKWPVSVASVSYGGATDLWGVTLSASDVNNSGFGVALSANCSRATQGNTIYVDYIRVTVYYTVSGNNYTQIISGAISPDGTLVRLTKKTLAGTITADSALTRATAKQLSGSLSPSSIIARLTTKVFGGEISPSSAIASFKMRLVALGGSLGLSGALTRRTTKALGGSLTSSSSIIRRTTKALGGSLGLSGALSSFKAALVTLSGSLSPSGAIKRTTLKKPSGSLSPSGAIKRTTLKSLVGALLPSGSLNRGIRKILSGELSFSGIIQAITEIFAGNPESPVVPNGILSYTLPGSPAVSGIIGSVFLSPATGSGFVVRTLPGAVMSTSLTSHLLPGAPRTAIILTGSAPAAPGAGGMSAISLPKAPVTQGGH